MIVVDASVIAAVVLREEGWGGLVQHLRDAVTLDQAFKEAGNAIWKAALRRYLDKGEAEKAFTLMKSLMEVLEIRDESRYLDQAFKISLETGLTIYDSLYLALARSERRPLLTLDKNQKEVAEKLGILTLALE